MEWRKEQEAGGQEGCGARQHGWNVLVVDDSRSTREMVSAVLSFDEIFGTVYEAGDGEEVFGLLGSGIVVDLIIMDIRMPRMDGFELINRLKSAEEYKEIPILVLSADARGEIKTMGLNIGASDYVVKPFDQGELIARAKLQIRRKVAQDELRRRNRDLADINERLKTLAVTDELTGLSNRSHFFEKMDREMKRCRRHGIRMTLLLIDLDDFKAVNDTYGHIAGDEVLRQVASVLTACVRDNDSVGRFGGEEFISYLVHTNAGEAAVPAERVRSSVADLVFHSGHQTYGVTASIGLATYPAGDAGESRTDFMKRADDALYEAKRGGKNTIVVDAASVS